MYARNLERRWVAVVELIELIANEPGIRSRADESMARHLPLRVGGPVELWVEAEDEDALQRLLAHTRSAGGKWRVHWPFSDWLVRDGGLKGTVIRLGQGFERIVVHEDQIELGSTALWSAVPREVTGGLWDAVRTWPGTVGGFFAGPNLHQLSRLCTEVRIARGGRIQTMKWSDDGSPPAIGETSVLTGITLRRAAASSTWLTPPLRAGTLFADVPDTTVARELNRAGVLGTRLRRWRLSPTEPGTIVHLGGSSYKDLQMLVQGIRMRVEKTRGVSLETRIPVLGNDTGRRTV